MRTLITCVLLAVIAGPSAHAADRYKVGDTVQCDATQIGNFKTGKVVGIKPRPGWPDPFYEVHLEGERDPSLCLPKFMKAASAGGAGTPPDPTRQQPDNQPTQPTTPGSQTGRYKVGDTVQCDATQIGNFKTGKVVGIRPRPGWPDPFYEVLLEGEGDPSLCLPKFMKAGSAGGAGTPTHQTKQSPKTPGSQEAGSSSNPLCVKGKKVEAALGISWYAATVLAPPDANGMCLVHYDGYPSLYDIPVSASSLRPPGSGPIVKPSRPVDESETAAPASGLKLGEYACYGSGGAVLAGLGFKVVSAGRYTDLDGKSSGTFTVAGSTVTFRGGHLDGQTGRNLNAKGQFVTHLYATCEPW